MSCNPHDQIDFDNFASNYSDCVNDAISISGEDKDYFARARVVWTKRYLNQHVRSVLDYGCGIGSLARHILELMPQSLFVGVDVSNKSVEVARNTYRDNQQTRFATFTEYQPSEEIDLAWACNVFHHIEPDLRQDALAYIHSSLRPGGIFALWEQNPWNPGTRYIMRQCAFDRDAKTMTPPYAKKLLRANGFVVDRTDFLFIFPRVLRWLRPLEPALSPLPFGAQYLVLARKPSS
jgi:SAM-dependent methyltransferase